MSQQSRLCAPIISVVTYQKQPSGAFDHHQEYSPGTAIHSCSNKDLFYKLWKCQNGTSNMWVLEVVGRKFEVLIRRELSQRSSSMNHPQSSKGVFLGTRFWATTFRTPWTMDKKCPFCRIYPKLFES